MFDVERLCVPVTTDVSWSAQELYCDQEVLRCHGVQLIQLRISWSMNITRQIVVRKKRCEVVEAGRGIFLRSESRVWCQTAPGLRMRYW